MNAKTASGCAEWLKLLLLVAVIFSARSSLADHYYVPSGSMEYTLLSGDRVLVDKTAYGLRVPFTDVEILGDATVARGDVVIFDSPRNGDRLIKRIVGIGGDTVTLRNGRLEVNGEPLAGADRNTESFGERRATLNLSDGGGPELAGLSIPPGMLLAMGDHRGNSFDGRYFGLIAEDEVYGRAIAVYRRKGEGFVWRPL